MPVGHLKLNVCLLARVFVVVVVVVVVVAAAAYSLIVT